MKKILNTLLLAGLLLAALPAAADDDRPISKAELPARSQQFLAQHFPDVEISYATVDVEFFDKEYKVLLVNGAKVTFAKNGDWKEVTFKHGEVPAAITPKPICEEVARRFPAQTIVQIEQDARDYEVELNNGVELTFDRKFRLRNIDD